ncbi:MAG TPA: sulfatase-like hydrolase/transferase, partial [Thermogutta sp.]|nr:sulfatase-like hydrolase/transferase [Thermogutta sp.]
MDRQRHAGIGLSFWPRIFLIIIVSLVAIGQTTIGAELAEQDRHTSLQSGVVNAGEVKPTATRPNILWLTLEDVNCHFGCYGDSYATTPNIDRLAKEGIRYTNAI